MEQKDYHTRILVNASASEAFRAINNVTKWWTENLEGNSQKLNDEFTVRFGDVHMSKQKLVELIPDKKVVWLVTDSQLNFVKDKEEWTNSKIVFEITNQNNQTRVDFTHIGLVPQGECYDSCSNAWTGYIQGSLKDLINTGKGYPTKKAEKESNKTKTTRK